MIAPLGARVAQPDEELEGADHGGWEATDEEGRLGARGRIVPPCNARVVNGLDGRRVARGFGVVADEARSSVTFARPATRSGIRAAGYLRMG